MHKKGLIKSIFTLLMFAISFLLISFLILEEFSKNDCAKRPTNWSNPCGALREKYEKELSLDNFFLNTNLAKEINDDSIDYVIAERTTEADRDEMNDVNGIYCTTRNFVAEDLPGKSKRYVKIHEAIHFLGIYDETQTNYLAGKKEPLGLLQTVLYSVFSNLKSLNSENYQCKLGGMWTIFKVYFLGGKLNY